MTRDTKGRKATALELSNDLLVLKKVCKETHERYSEKGSLRFTTLYSVLRDLCEGRLLIRREEDGICGLGVETLYGAKHAVSFQKGNVESEIAAMNNLIDWAWENGGRDKVAAIERFHPPPAA